MPVLSQLKMLTNLARIDGQVAEKEQLFITNIGIANGMKAEEIKPLFAQGHEIIVPTDLTDDQKFDLIFSLVQLMKIDERLYKDEIKYCSKVAASLGYNPDVMFELMLNVRGAAMQPNEIDVLKKLIARYI
jgi:uncharacterized tellurite resistance protein B-like protein